MREVNAEELKRVQLSILDQVAGFCEEAGISYWLDSGTLLGAIRHKGYIPWDDDIDIGMLRPDYERFLKEFNCTQNRYKVYSIENNEGFYYPHAKILDTETVLYEPDINGVKLSINIDVFVYDHAPKSERITELMYKARDVLRKCNQLRNFDQVPEGTALNKAFFSIIKKCITIFPRSFFAKMMMANSKLYKDKDQGYVGNFTSYSRIHCRKEIFSSFIHVEFEGKQYKAPVGYDEWLRAFYRDYMQLPPEEKRVSHHRFVAYIK